MQTPSGSSLLAVLAVLLVSGCKSAEAENSTTRNAPAQATLESSGATSSPDPSAASRLDEDDEEFLKDAAVGGLFEVEAGRLAQRKAENPAVKEFGARMVSDHGRANDELEAIASAKGVSLPSELDDEKRGMIAHLTEASGREFDRAYVEHMVHDHEIDVKEFERATREVKDDDLRGWASKTLPVLREHLELARRTQGKL